MYLLNSYDPHDGENPIIFPVYTFFIRWQVPMKLSSVESIT